MKNGKLIFALHIISIHQLFGMVQQKKIDENLEESLLMLISQDAPFEKFTLYRTLTSEVKEVHNHNRTALHWAAAKGRTDICELLLHHGAIVDAFDYDFATPLDLAAEKGHIDTCELLIKNGATINSKYTQWNTPLHHAARNNNTALCQFLLKAGAKIQKAQRNRDTPLHYAVQNGNSEIVTLLLEHGADIDDEGEGGTPLIVASREGHTQLCHILVNHGAKVNAQVSVRAKAAHLRNKTHESSALIYAAARGDESLCLYLIHKGAKTDCFDCTGSSILHWAAAYGSIALCKMALSKDINVNIKNDDGETPLLWAAQEGKDEAVALLLENNADATIKSSKYDGILKSETALEAAASKGFIKIIALLLEKNPCSQEALIKAVERGEVKICALMLEKDVDLATKDLALQNAAKNGKIAICALLLEKGATLFNHQKQTSVPLNRAASSYNVLTCQFILRELLYLSLGAMANRALIRKSLKTAILVFKRHSKAFHKAIVDYIFCQKPLGNDYLLLLADHYQELSPVQESLLLKIINNTNFDIVKKAMTNALRVATNNDIRSLLNPHTLAERTRLLLRNIKN